MAVTITDTPATGILTCYNVLNFELTAGAGEEWIQVRLKDDTAVVIVELEAKTVRADNTILVDVSPYLQSQLAFNDNTSNVRNATGSDVAEFTYQFSFEVRTDLNGTYTAVGSAYDYMDAVRDIVEDIQGSRIVGPDPNLSEFNAVEGTGGTVTTQGKYLTALSSKKLYWQSDIAEPTANSDICVFQAQNVYSLEAAFTDLDFRVTFYKNGTPTTLSYSPTTNNQRGRHPVFQADNIWDNDYCVVQVVSPTAGVPEVVCEMRYDPVRICSDNVVIKYINPYGAFETFAFEGRVPRTNEVESIGRYISRLGTLANRRGKGRDFKKVRTTSIDVFKDDLTLEEAKALEYLLDSPLALMYVGEFTANADTEEWIEVIVSGGGIPSYDTFDSKHKVSYTLELPRKYTMSN